MSTEVIAVAGTGYVGLSIATLLSQQHKVIAVDVIPEKVEKINHRISPIQDEYIEKYLAEKDLNLTATLDGAAAYKQADFVVIAAPTNYDPVKNYFDTSHVEEVIDLVLEVNPDAVMIIKSTIPVGYCRSLYVKYAEKFHNTSSLQGKKFKLLFSPEFLRESKALYDNLYPSRIVIGEDSDRARILGKMLTECAYKKDIPILYTHSTEAEAIKLFSNTYLATRVAFFNELDSYALAKGLDSKAIINGVTLDPRIGHFYCNPSFGYGGYCLPKDTKQLLANFKDVPENMIRAVVEANRTRKDYITQLILNKKPKIVGIYRLIMKSGSDNFRASAIQGIMRRLSEAGVKLFLFEPSFNEDKFFTADVIRDINEFKSVSDVIVTNRWNDDLLDVKDKVFTRDLFCNN